MNEALSVGSAGLEKCTAETEDHKIIYHNMQTNKGITRLVAKLKLL